MLSGGLTEEDIQNMTPEKRRIYHRTQMLEHESKNRMIKEEQEEEKSLRKLADMTPAERDQLERILTLKRDNKNADKEAKIAAKEDKLVKQVETAKATRDADDAKVKRLTCACDAATKKGDKRRAEGELTRAKTKLGKSTAAYDKAINALSLMRNNAASHGDSVEHGGAVSSNATPAQIASARQDRQTTLDAYLRVPTMEL